MPRKYDFAEVFRKALDARTDSLHVAMPGIVIKFNKDRNTVDVAPQYKRVIEDDETGELVSENLPSIPDVPIAWPRGGGHWITWPLAKGDAVTLMFLDFDPGLWRATGEVVSPGDLRSHALGNACAMPGIATESACLTSAQIADDAIVIGSKVSLGSATASEPMVKGTTFKALYDAHVHPSPFGPTGQTVPLLPTALSTKHKLDS